MNLRCAIIDDEPLALGLLESYVKKTPVLTLCGTYSSAVQAMKSLPEHPADLLFLDIQMPELNGLEFSRMVSENTRIVFTTAFNQYAIDGYRVNALDYLLKPISYADFMEIELDKILYIEGLKDYIKIHLEGMEKPILSLISMRAMEEKLPADRFIRVHRSFIVQKQKIKIIDKGRIVFGKDYIPVSDSYKQELQNYVNEHIV